MHGLTLALTLLLSARTFPPFLSHQTLPRFQVAFGTAHCPNKKQTSKDGIPDFLLRPAVPLLPDNSSPMASGLEVISV